MADIKDILDKYSRKLEGEIKTEYKPISSVAGNLPGFSQEFATFKKEMLPTPPRQSDNCIGESSILFLQVIEGIIPIVAWVNIKNDKIVGEDTDIKEVPSPLPRLNDFFIKGCVL